MAHAGHTSVKAGIFSLTIACLAGGPVISAAHAKSVERADLARQKALSAKKDQPSAPASKDKLLRSLVAPHVAKPTERSSVPHETAAADWLRAVPDVLTAWIEATPLISQQRCQAHHPPFDAHAPPF